MNWFLTPTPYWFVCKLKRQEGRDIYNVPLTLRVGMTGQVEFGQRFSWERMLSAQRNHMGKRNLEIDMSDKEKAELVAAAMAVLTGKSGGGCQVVSDPFVDKNGKTRLGLAITGGTIWSNAATHPKVVVDVQSAIRMFQTCADAGLASITLTLNCTAATSKSSNAPVVATEPKQD